MTEFVYAVRLYAHLRIEADDSDSARRAVASFLERGRLPAGERVTLPDGRTATVTEAPFAPYDDSFALVECDGCELNTPSVTSIPA